MFRYGFGLFLALHGVIHLLGFLKSFQLMALPDLTVHINRPAGALWLLCSLVFIAAGALWAFDGAHAAVLALGAVAVSTVLILASYRDSKVGLIGNALVLVPLLVVAIRDLGGSGFRAIYRAQVAKGVESTVALPALTEAELAPLPAAVRTYLRRTGALDSPRARNFRARFAGEMRPSPQSGWMSITAEQHTFAAPAERLFYLRASRFGVPFEALHLYSPAGATMQVRVASLFDMVDARGPTMNQSETVTYFNDLCLFAPSMLVGADIQWEELDARTVRATFHNAGQTVHATLSFDEAGDLTGFVSEDRYLSEDGKTYVLFPWSTPVLAFRDFDGVRLPERAEAIWKQPEGDFVYARFRLTEIEYNVGL